MTPIQKPDVSSMARETLENIITLGLFGITGGLAAKGAARLAKKAVEKGEESLPPERKLREYIRLEKDIPELREWMKKHRPKYIVPLKTIDRFVPERGCEEFDPMRYLLQTMSPEFILGTTTRAGYTEEFVERCAGKSAMVSGLDFLIRGGLPFLMMNPFTAGLGAMLLTEAVRSRANSDWEKVGRGVAEGALDVATHGAYSVAKKMISGETPKNWKEDAAELAVTLFSPGLSLLF